MYDKITYMLKVQHSSRRLRCRSQKLPQDQSWHRIYPPNMECMRLTPH